MSLKIKFMDMLKESMRAKDEVQTSCIRLLISAIKNKEIELQREATDEDILKLVQKQAKQRNESIAAFKAAGRTEMAQKEEKELAILNALLPQKVNKTTVMIGVGMAIFETKAMSSKDFGMVMKSTMQKFQGKVDGKLVSECVKEGLQEWESKPEAERIQWYNSANPKQ